MATDSKAAKAASHIGARTERINLESRPSSCPGELYVLNNDVLSTRHCDEPTKLPSSQCANDTSCLNAGTLILLRSEKQEKRHQQPASD
jgi:hypothetical protein